VDDRVVHVTEDRGAARLLKSAKEGEMLPHGWKKYGLGAASMLVLVIAILLVSGWGTAVADQLNNVFVTNTSANPVPVSGTLTINNPPASPLAVRETNTDANGNIKVDEQGTVQVGGSVSVSNLPGTQPVSGTVNVGNFPAAPETDLIASGPTTFDAAGEDLIGGVNISAYREVTLYLSVPGAAGSVTCYLSTRGPLGPATFSLGTVTTGSDGVGTKTVDPAPPNFRAVCVGPSGGLLVDWMLVGRTG
jgi:hypothetical protein